jgi:hypothetical protein
MIHLHPDIKINNTSDRLLELSFYDNSAIFETPDAELKNDSSM